MPKRITKPLLNVFFSVLLLAGSVGAELDRTRYIPLDEVQTDMEAYTRTVWYGTKIETFPLKILSVVRNRQPGSDMILVVSPDERFKNSGAIHGCSGSPVFIDGRLAGALAAGWDGALEPLYLVRPIEDMLAVGTASGTSAAEVRPTGMTLALSETLDLKAVYAQIMQRMTARRKGDALPLSMATSLPSHLWSDLADSLDLLGISALPAGMTAGAAAGAQDAPIEPGSVLAAVLCNGDINLAAVGTATEVMDGTVYGFGHSFTGVGPVELPMSAGWVHSVVPGRGYSFKFTSPGEVVGTIQFDQNAAVRGKIGIMPTMVPLRIFVDRFNDPEKRTYACQVAYDREFTPLIVRVVTVASALMQGTLPPEHTVRYSGRIAVEGHDPIVFENVSSGNSVNELGLELVSTLSLLLNNPFEQLAPKEIELKITIEPTDRTSAFWSARLSQATVKPGQTIRVDVTLQSFRQAQTTWSMDLTIPQTMPPGKYPLHLLGASAYNAFLMKNAPQRFRVVDAGTLVAGLNRVLNAPRDRLYAVLQVPATGLAMRHFELPDLPPTHMLVINDARRAEPIDPYRSWVESSTEVDKIISGAIQIELTVEQP